MLKAAHSKVFFLASCEFSFSLIWRDPNFHFCPAKYLRLLILKVTTLDFKLFRRLIFVYLDCSMALRAFCNTTSFSVADVPGLSYRRTT